MGKLKPYVLRHVHNVTRLDYVVVAETFGGAVRYIHAPLWAGVGPAVVDGYIMPEWLPGNPLPRFEASNTPLQVALDGIKRSMLTNGATPEAVVLFLLIGELTKKEMTMAKDKLAGKGAVKETPAKAAAKADKKVEKVASPKGKGNPEALAKARQAQAERSSALKAQKVKALVKIKDIKVREGSFRETMLTDLLASKTVGEFYEKGEAKDLKYDAGCVRFAEEKEYIELA